MTFSDLLPTSEQLAGVQGIERSLLQRRRTGTVLSAALAIGAAVLQAALLFSRLVPLPEKGKTITWAAIGAALKGPEAVVFGIVILAVAVYLIVRYTGFLFKESKEPFQYTFCIQPFARVKETPGDRFSLAQDDVLSLIHYDLCERLNRRIGRLSLLQHPAQADKATNKDGNNLTAHIHIEGDYALRQEKDGCWVLHVLPRVRIGSDTNPFTLAFSVRYPLEIAEAFADPATQAAGSTPKQSALLGADQYEQLIERVYSSIATEIYRQIKADVEKKIGMFPTSYLKAVARYHEARDFERSNTLDSYDRALELYEAARESFGTSIAYRIKRNLSRVDMLWWWVSPAIRAEARTRLGFSRCLIYRRVVSNLAGRKQNSLFEIRRELYRARNLFEQCYDRVVPGPDLHFLKPRPHDALVDEEESQQQRDYRALRASLTFPEDTPWKRRRRSVYLSLREELCEAYAVSALGCGQLADLNRAAEFLKIAQALEPQKDSNKALILLAKSFIEGSLRNRIANLRRACELAPDSEIVRYRLAVSLDMLARSLNEITTERVDALRREYESVLRINPGNIASLIGQGYLLWLVGDLDRAEKVFSAGNDLQEIVSQTFVGDLKYGLARVAAEKAARCFADFPSAPEGSPEQDACLKKAVRQIDTAFRAYEEAVAADPAVAASYLASTRVMNSYYEFVGSTMLDRYRRFAESLALARDTAARLAGTSQGRELSIEALDVVLSYALSDYGNASLNYFLRFEMTRGKPLPKPHLEEAICQLEAAVQRKDRNFTARYNLALAYSWKGLATDSQRQAVLLDEVVNRYPNWLEAVRTRCRMRLYALQDQITRARAEVADLRSRADDAEKRLRESRSEQFIEKETLDLREHQVRNLNEAIAAKQKELANLTADLAKEPERALDGIIANTRLDSLKDRLKAIDPSQTDSLADLLKDDTVQWCRFGESEALALGAWAEVLSNMQDSAAASEASRLLCTHILNEYYPEHYDTLRILLFAIIRSAAPHAPGRLDISDYEERLLAALDRAEKFDPDSTFYAYLRGDYHDGYANLVYNARGHKPFGEGDYKSAAKLYKRAWQTCGDVAVYHANFASALEKREKRLLDDRDTPARRKAASKLRITAITGWERACGLDPENKEYRASLISLRSRQWAYGHDFAPVLNSYAPTYLIELQIPQSSLADFLKPEGPLKEGLQERITALRQRLRQELGITLPGVMFRDNAQFAANQYRLLVRDVMAAEGFLQGATLEQKWDSLISELESVARLRIADYFGPQDVMNMLTEWKTGGTGSLAVDESAESFAGLTLVMKGLLSERVPVTALDIILPMFAAGRAGKLDLLTIGERIRSAAGIRERLPGNDPAKPLHFIQFGEQIENEIDGCMDRSWPEVFFSGDMTNVINLMTYVAGGLQNVPNHQHIGILTSALNRPVAKRLIEPQFPGIPVLSEREILPALAGAIEGEL